MSVCSGIPQHNLDKRYILRVCLCGSPGFVPPDGRTARTQQCCVLDNNGTAARPHCYPYSSVRAMCSGALSSFQRVRFIWFQATSQHGGNRTRSSRESVSLRRSDRTAATVLPVRPLNCRRTFATSDACVGSVSSGQPE